MKTLHERRAEAMARIKAVAGNARIGVEYPFTGIGAVDAPIAREFMEYDPETGVCRWKSRNRKWFQRENDRKRFESRNAGKEISRRNAGGYLIVKVKYTSYLLHRLIWLIQTGDWPKDGIDHINGNPSDNRWTNLREATQSENNRNRRMSRNNTSGHNNVSFKNGKWRARIILGNEDIHLGVYDKEKDAVSVQWAARMCAGGFTERHGKKETQ